MDNKNSVISLSIPFVGEEEKKALVEVIDSGWLSMGAKVEAFESAFVELHGYRTAVAVSSCTAALHLILRAFGIGPGDEVLVPSLTFVATVNAVLYVGATPVFLDIEGIERPHISLEDAIDKCSPRTRAVIVMPYGGFAMDMMPWRDFCDAKKIKLIEDAAHASGAPGTGRASDASAFSFFANKNMTTAEGGMVLAADDDLLNSVRRMRGHGMTADTMQRHRGHAYSYDVTTLGYNYRMDELRAAVGLVQLRELPERNRKRASLCGLYRQKIGSEIPSIIVPFGPEHLTSGHLLPVLLSASVRREEVMDRLRRSGIQTSIHYPPLHRFSYYRELYPGVALPKTEEFCRRELSLPLHPGLTTGDVDRVVAGLMAALEKETWP